MISIKSTIHVKSYAEQCSRHMPDPQLRTSKHHVLSTERESQVISTTPIRNSHDHHERAKRRHSYHIAYRERQLKQHIHPSTTHSSPKCSILIEPLQLLTTILNILSRLHPHIKDRAIFTAANDLTMHTSLTSLALCP